MPGFSRASRGAPGCGAQTQLEHLFSSVKTFTAGAAQNDDVTVLVVGYRGSRPAIGT